MPLDDLTQQTTTPSQQTAQTPSAPAAVVTPSQTASGTQTAPISGSATAGTPQIGLASQATTAPATQTPMSVVQALASQYGLDLGVQDDHAALARLSQAYQWAQQNHQLVQYGQQYMQHADQFQAFLRERQQAAQTQQQTAQKQGWGWSAPEYDPSWTQKIFRDQNGNLAVAPGSDPGIIQKYMAWSEHQRQVMDNLARDPLKVIQPGLEQLIDQRAQALIEQRMAASQEQNGAREFVRQHSGWLHQRDQQGQLVMDQRTGMPALSPTGQRFGQYVQQAEQLGLNTQGQVQYALGMTQRDVMYAQLASQQQGQLAGVPAHQVPAAVDPAQVAQAARDQFLSQASVNAGQNRQAQVAAGQQPNVNGQPPPMAASAHSLRERMAADFAAAGILPHQTVFG